MNRRSFLRASAMLSAGAVLPLAIAQPMHTIASRLPGTLEQWASYPGILVGLPMLAVMSFHSLGDGAPFCVAWILRPPVIRVEHRYTVTDTEVPEVARTECWLDAPLRFEAVEGVRCDSAHIVLGTPKPHALSSLWPTGGITLLPGESITLDGRHEPIIVLT